MVKAVEGRLGKPCRFGEGTFCFCGELKDHQSEHVCGHCCVQTMTSKENTQEKAFVQHFKQSLTDEEIKRKLNLLHSATGHCSTNNMVKALKTRGAPERVIKLAEQFTCDICLEKRKVGFKHVASLEALPPKLATLCADGGHWRHEGQNKDDEFVVLIDEGSRFRTARFLGEGKKNRLTGQQFLDYMQEGWVQYFGAPQTLRLDPAGPFRSHLVEDYCDRAQYLSRCVAGRSPLEVRHL